MDIPYPSQHTMSGNHQPVMELSFKCLRCCIAKKGRREDGVGVGDRLESPFETHSIFVVFFCMCCCFLRFVGWGGGGLIVDIVCFIE